MLSISKARHTFPMHAKGIIYFRYLDSFAVTCPDINFVGSVRDLCRHRIHSLSGERVSSESDITK